MEDFGFEKLGLNDEMETLEMAHAHNDDRIHSSARIVTDEGLCRLSPISLSVCCVCSDRMKIIRILNNKSSR